MYWEKHISRRESKRLRSLRMTWSSIDESSSSPSSMSSTRSFLFLTRPSSSWYERKNHPVTERMSSSPSLTDLPIAASTSASSINLSAAVSSSSLTRRSTGLQARRRLLRPSQTKLQSSSSWFTLFVSSMWSKNSDKLHFLAKILSRFTFKKMECSVSTSALPRVSSSVREVFAVAGLAPAAGDLFLPDRRLELLLANSDSEFTTLIADVAMVASSDDINSTIRSRSSTTIFRSCALDSVTRA
mmetsp:Transcript_19300/g.27483  ORF Transcript_19300/g.27483 Transcript_19300/m.27483 type:complete len:243 (+) Transcript_19300:972-1700(+)